MVNATMTMTIHEWRQWPCCFRFTHSSPPSSSQSSCSVYSGAFPICLFVCLLLYRCTFVFFLLFRCLSYFFGSFLPFLSFSSSFFSFLSVDQITFKLLLNCHQIIFEPSSIYPHVIKFSAQSLVHCLSQQIMGNNSDSKENTLFCDTVILT